jgi:hypothetical protein
MPEGRHVRDTLPEGSVVHMEIEVVGYIEPGEDDLKWAMRTEGDVPVSTFLGHLDLAKYRLLVQTQSGPDT